MVNSQEETLPECKYQFTMSNSKSAVPEAIQASSVLYEARGAVALITLNRPQALNSFTRQMHHDLWAALDLAESDGKIRALVITGAGRGFCAGADLSEFDFAPGPDLIKRADPGPVIDQAFNPTAPADPLHILWRSINF